MTDRNDLCDPRRAALWLMTPEAVRLRARAMLELGLAGRLGHFQVDLSRLEAAADYVVRVIREAYPTLDIPYHARWRHFAVGGVDRWAALAATVPAGTGADEIGRIRVDLAVVSVLLDAGAGPRWRYVEPGRGMTLARSEGLAVASLHAFQAGLFSADRENPLRADAAALADLTPQALAEAFQANDANPLAGLDGRAALLRNLGLALGRHPALFGRDAPRIGGLYDHLKASATEGALTAPRILAAVLEGFGPIWPGRLDLGGLNLGDVWRHDGIRTGDATDGLVPFHKLSQWLSYSLAEIFEDAGIRVGDLDRLTGLPEYRNGGLFLDLGVLRLKDPSLAATPLGVGHPAIVEWRALTVALLDLIADPVRRRLGLSAEALPLARILEGGTWAAGRRIAAEMRPGGGPPLQVASDGTVF